MVITLQKSLLTIKNQMWQKCVQAVTRDAPVLLILSRFLAALPSPSPSMNSHAPLIKGTNTNCLGGTALSFNPTSSGPSLYTTASDLASPAYVQLTMSESMCRYLLMCLSHIWFSEAMEPLEDQHLPPWVRVSVVRKSIPEQITRFRRHRKLFDKAKASYPNGSPDLYVLVWESDHCHMKIWNKRFIFKKRNLVYGVSYKKNLSWLYFLYKFLQNDILLFRPLQVFYHNYEGGKTECRNAFWITIWQPEVKHQYLSCNNKCS